MGALMFLPAGLEKSPYAFLLDPTHHHEVTALLANDACALLGLSVKSHLSVM